MNILSILLIHIQFYFCRSLCLCPFISQYLCDSNEVIAKFRFCCRFSSRRDDMNLARRFSGGLNSYRPSGTKTDNKNGTLQLPHNFHLSHASHFLRACVKSRCRPFRACMIFELYPGLRFACPGLSTFAPLGQANG